MAVPKTITGFIDAIINEEPVIASGRNDGPFEDDKQALPVFYAIQICRMLKHFSADRVEDNQIPGLQQQLSQLHSTIKDSMKFRTISGPQSTQQRDIGAEKLRTQATTFVREVSPLVITLLAMPGALLLDAEKRLDRTKATLERLNEQVHEIDKNVSDSRSLIAEVRETAANATVTSFKNHFSDVANTERECAQRWFIATICSIGFATIVGIAFIIISAFTKHAKSLDPTSAQDIVVRLIVVSILYLAIIWSMRNYRAHKHLAAVNDHRSRALEVFPIMLESVGGDQASRNSLLVEACSCIYGANVTGFLGPDENVGSNPLVDAARSLLAKS